MNTKKKAFIEVFRRNTGNIKATCEKVGMGRTTYYNRIDDDKDFETEVQNVNEELIDYAESQLHTKISQGNLTAIIFFLKCKGQTRGYPRSARAPCLAAAGTSPRSACRSRGSGCAAPGAGHR